MLKGKHVYLPSTGEAEAEGSLGLAGQPAGMNGQTPSLVRSPTSKNKVERYFKRQPRLTYGFYTHACQHT